MAITKKDTIRVMIITKGHRIEGDRLVASPPFIVVAREAISAVFPREE